MCCVVAFLSALLPGLRKIRTPIFVGYCWIGVAWLVLRPYLPSPKEAEGTIAVVYEVGQSIPNIIIVGVVTVVAYVIGALTVLVLMWTLGLLPVPAKARTIFLRREELAQWDFAYGNFREEPTVPYVRNGVLPPELYRLEGFPNAFGRICAQAEFRWSAPLPVLFAGLYLAYLTQQWWIVPLALAPILLTMADGYRCFRLACRMLSRAGVTQASRMHAEAMQAWDQRRAY
jgi:hypothetical protein